MSKFQNLSKPMQNIANDGTTDKRPQLVSQEEAVPTRAAAAKNNGGWEAVRDTVRRFALKIIFSFSPIIPRDAPRGMLLINAARDGDTVTVRTLLSAADAQSLMNYQDGNGATPLYKDGCALQGWTDAHKDGYTPLFIAAANGHASVTKQLIEARCNMNLQEKDGSTPLLVAAANGHASVTKQLIEARCNIVLADKNGASPLHEAVRHKAAPCCAL
jgi:hypothetical protein